jgi:hypothetical protein
LPVTLPASSTGRIAPAHFAAMDIPASSQRTREQLGWQPKQPGVIPDLDRPRYFEI